MDELLIVFTKYDMTFKEFLLTEAGDGDNSDFFYGLLLFPSDASDYSWANDNPSELFFLKRRWQIEKGMGRKFHNIDEPGFQKIEFVSVQDKEGTPKVVKHDKLISLAIGKNSEDRRELTTENPPLSFDLDSIFGDRGTNSIPRALESTGQVLYGQLMALRPRIAQAAQAIYNDWEQDEFDTGGICDEISQAIAGVVSSIPGVDITEGGHDGDDHAYIIAYNDTEAYEVDIPPYVYEKGGGYNWTKIPNVVITANDVVVHEIPRKYVQESVNVIGYDTVSPNKTGVFNQGMGIRSKYVGPDDTGENPNEEKPKVADFGFERSKKRRKSKKHMHK